VQGLFGKYTVTLKLYPAIVTLHLLGGLLLLALLAVQHESYRARPVTMPAGLRRLAGAALGVLALQIALGGWVSTNYAVLACPDFPRCHGQWLPPMDFASGFQVLRELGGDGRGGLLPFDALVAIHMAHRVFAIVASAVLLACGIALLRRAPAELRGFGLALVALTAAQVASGLSNVILGWPLAAALAHSAGAAGLVLTLTLLLARTSPGLAAPSGEPPAARASSPLPGPA
jgi:cytochrome c oxidase assembly protein subunit 15